MANHRAARPSLTGADLLASAGPLEPLPEQGGTVCLGFLRRIAEGAVEQFTSVQAKSRIWRVAGLTAQKHLGAFYTPSRVAQVLVEWAVRSARDRVLDPACGEGVFLLAGSERVTSLGGYPEKQVQGIELDPSVYSRVLIPLLARLGIARDKVFVSDFFELTPGSLRPFDAVVGNPPFIRYQTFKGRTREKAVSIAKGLGVELSELSSSWAPFLLHATRFLSVGGRLAMVVPAEITHAAYARPIVQFIAKTFEKVYLASFEERLFPELSQDTLLLFAEGFGVRGSGIRMQRFKGIRELAGAIGNRNTFGSRLSLNRLQTTNGRLRNHFLPREVSALYNFLGAAFKTCRLGELASAGIGYVTGNNDFFHLSRQQVSEYRIKKAFLRPALLRSGMVSGLEVSREDWLALTRQGEKVFVLNLPKYPESSFPPAVREYLAEGKKRGVHTAYKCVVRKPWYCLSLSEPAGAFLTYMSGDFPKIVWNAARLLATNSLHEVRFKQPDGVEPWRISLAFCSSLSQLSCEIEGHPLGGGMLKLEPSEAERILVVRPEAVHVSKGQFSEIDSLVRAGASAAAIDLADELILRKALGLTWDQIQVLREGLGEMRERRRKNNGTR